MWHKAKASMLPRFRRKSSNGALDRWKAETLKLEARSLRSRYGNQFRKGRQSSNRCRILPRTVRFRIIPLAANVFRKQPKAILVGKGTQPESFPMFMGVDKLQGELPPQGRGSKRRRGPPELLEGKYGEMSTLGNLMFKSFNFRSKSKLPPFSSLIASIRLGHVAPIQSKRP
ncbi:hypothetical protein CPY51_24135 [Rhizobium tubonense]|uniref:Uncharacterized protein n=1 Tax=Rhizobium tubonense TaxID=484088 RepID=A0A2W4CXN4_9HYPH|nr:hypothetical protein CPY51_24135 [Rhizobium tubonense]